MSGPNRAIYAKDCLDVLTDENAIPSESVDLIYLDPPFNSKSNYNLPFKNKEYKKNCKPVEAFKDTWSWGDDDEENLEKLFSSDRTLADIVWVTRKTQRDRPGKKLRTDAYILHMAMRLRAMKSVLKPTGSLYLHCDPTASHYLKLVLDHLFGSKNFKNEIVWSYRTGGATKRHFGRKHDTIFFYSKSKDCYFQIDKERSYLTGAMGHRKNAQVHEDEHGRYQNVVFSQTDIKLYKDERGYYTMVNGRDSWNIDAVGRTSAERLGYPTQKPLALLQRIISTSCPGDGIVLDPFCGCGTAVHAAEKLGRRWIGIDISPFSAGLIRTRIVDNFKNLSIGDIPVFGVPLDLAAARFLARSDPFEFEKWACGAVGAQGMYHPPGTRGADGGIDGVIPFYHSPPQYQLGGRPETAQAVVQVKGGRVSPDSVRAITHTIKETGSKCGVIVCFEQYMNTIENNRARGYFDDHEGRFPIVQGLSVERLLAGDRPRLPRAA